MNSLLSSYIRILFIFIFTNTPVPWSLPTHLIYIKYLLVFAQEWVTFFEVGDPNRTTQEKPYPILLTVHTPRSLRLPELGGKQWGRHEEFCAHKKLSHPWWCRILSTQERHPLLIPITQTFTRPSLLWTSKPRMYCTFEPLHYSCPSPPFRALKKHINCRVSFLAKNSGRSDSRCASPLTIDLQLRSTEPI